MCLYPSPGKAEVAESQICGQQGLLLSKTAYSKRKWVGSKNLTSVCFSKLYIILERQDKHFIGPCVFSVFCLFFLFFFQTGSCRVTQATLKFILAISGVGLQASDYDTWWRVESFYF